MAEYFGRPVGTIDISCGNAISHVGTLMYCLAPRMRGIQ